MTKRSLKGKVVEQLRASGYTSWNGELCPPKLQTKDDIRALHSRQRQFRLERERHFLASHAESLIGYFADGCEIDPAKMAPILVEVKAGTEEAGLFRFATFLWSVPVSQGFGRRLKFLVMDESNGRLVGLFGLGDPVFNLSARDKWIGWDVKQKADRLAHVFDAFVLGAVPPYSSLLCGKLIAALAASNEVREVFHKKYAGRETLIRAAKHRPELVLITTTSALGRSSQYNRLKIGDRLLYQNVGQTKGYGHFQFDTGLFEELRNYLSEMGHPYADGNRFGQGPNWKIRVIRVALKELGLNQDLLRHGIGREVYVVPLAENCQKFLRGEHNRLRRYDLPTSELVSYCMARWILPRAIRRTEYLDFRKSEILPMIMGTSHLQEGEEH